MCSSEDVVPDRAKDSLSHGIRTLSVIGRYSKHSEVRAVHFCFVSEVSSGGHRVMDLLVSPAERAGLRVL